MKKIVVRVLVGIFALVAILVTINLLAYNDYEVAEFGSKSFVLVDEHMQDYGYKKGDLLVTNKNTLENVKAGDEIIYYDIYTANVTVNKGSVVEISEDGSQLYLDNNLRSVARRNVLGTTEGAKTYSKIGGVLQVLESRVGYLLIILLPTLGIFAYLFRKIVVELKKEDKKN
ncbi:MAG: hypothetical protein IJL74_00440 [Bacilli bacterium]|nr:hypothetical protein [Bacilli bacterium]